MFSMLQKHTIANAIGPIAGQLKNTNVTFLGQCDLALFPLSCPSVALMSE